MKMLTHLLLAMFCIAISSCSLKYVTPGENVKISELSDEDVAKLLTNKPSAQFPTIIAVARLQDPNYSNHKYRGYRAPEEKKSNFSMILTRDNEEELALENIGKLQGVKAISPFNRLLLPYNYTSIKDLRLAAAKMKAHMLLVYTFDTEFTIDTKNYGPQNVFSLGYLKNKDVKVTTTASAALFDVQTEYLYGLAEATAHKSKRANAWKKQDEVDNLRIEAEKASFEKLEKEIENMWKGILQEYKQ